MRGLTLSAKGIWRKQRKEDRSYNDPQTDPVVGIRAGVRPLGKGGGGRRTRLGNLESSERADFRITNPEGRKGQAYGEVGNLQRTGLR